MDGYYAWFYSILIMLLALGGGGLPFLGRVTHTKLQFYLSVSAGVMLGASFFHVMPDAMELCGDGFGWWVSLGVVSLFCIERFVAPHSHEVNDHGKHAHDDLAHGHDHDHEHVHEWHEPRAAAPTVAGWMAVLGLTIHTFMNGVGLAGAVEAGGETTSLLGLNLPGFALFLAIFLHKPADALAISTVLVRKGVSRQKLLLVQLGFAATIPLGVGAFYATQHTIEQHLQNAFTGAALAFSAGTFLFIALSDLLPEVQFHRHDRIPLFLALIVGVGAMGGIALLEPHNHAPPPHASQDKDQKTHPDHDGPRGHHHD